jgi:hypothetical protein
MKTSVVGGADLEKSEHFHRVLIYLSYEVRVGDLMPARAKIEVKPASPVGYSDIGMKKLEPK